MSDIKPGTYRATAKSCGLGETKNGNPQICVEIELVDRDGVVLGNLPWYGYFTDDGFPIAFRALRALGWQGNDIGELDDCDCSKLLPNEGEAVVRLDEYEGQERVRVAFINAAGEGVRLAKRLDPAGKAKLAERLKARILLLEQQGGARRAAPKPAAQATGTDGKFSPDDDDIPF